MRLKKKNTAQTRIFKALFNSDSPLFELAFDILSNNFVSSSFFVHIFHSNDPSSFQRMRGKSARNSTTDGKESNFHCTSHLHEQKYKGKYYVAVSFAMILSFFVYALFVKRIIFSFQIHFAWIMDVSRCVRASFHSNWSGRVHTFFLRFLISTHSFHRSLEQWLLRFVSPEYFANVIYLTWRSPFNHWYVMVYFNKKRHPLFVMFLSWNSCW